MKKSKSGNTSKEYFVQHTGQILLYNPKLSSMGPELLYVAKDGMQINLGGTYKGWECFNITKSCLEVKYPTKSEFEQCYSVPNYEELALLFKTWEVKKYNLLYDKCTAQEEFLKRKLNSKLKKVS